MKGLDGVLLFLGWALFRWGLLSIQAWPPKLAFDPNHVRKRRKKRKTTPPHERGRETVARCLSGLILAASWPGDKCLMMMIEIYRFETERVHRKYSEGH